MLIFKYKRGKHPNCHKHNTTKNFGDYAKKGQYDGNKNPFYGKKHSEETKEKIRKARSKQIITEETKKKISLKNKGRIKSIEERNKLSLAITDFFTNNPEKRKEWSEKNKGKNNPMFGKENKWGHHNEETKKLLSKKKKGIPNIKNKILAKKRIGELSSAWKGGISKEPYSFEFNNKLKEYIRKRDKYKCRDCNINQKYLKEKLHIHHIDYNKKNCNSNNLISLCRKCHSKYNSKKRRQEKK